MVVYQYAGPNYVSLKAGRWPSENTAYEETLLPCCLALPHRRMPPIPSSSCWPQSAAVSRPLCAPCSCRGCDLEPSPRCSSSHPASPDSLPSTTTCVRAAPAGGSAVPSRQSPRPYAGTGQRSLIQACSRCDLCDKCRPAQYDRNGVRMRGGTLQRDGWGSVAYHNS